MANPEEGTPKTITWRWPKIISRTHGPHLQWAKLPALALYHWLMQTPPSFSALTKSAGNSARADIKVMVLCVAFFSQLKKWKIGTFICIFCNNCYFKEHTLDNGCYR